MAWKDNEIQAPEKVSTFFCIVNKLSDYLPADPMQRYDNSPLYLMTNEFGYSHYLFSG